MSPDRPTPFAAAALYLILSLVLTWPLALGIATDVPGDLGDSLLNMWILAWGAEHLPQILTGAITWQQFWNGNIFHPEPLTFALSEHLVGLTLQILPVYWISGNIILCYNLLFLASFAVSALGMFLLVRDLTGNARAAFIAGLIYGFLPYRIASVPHLQVLSSQWMPFALWGLNRFLTRPRDFRALAVGVGALILQNLSCVYYVFFFAPFVLLFVLHRVVTAGRMRDLRMWGALAVGGAVTVAITLPFLLPYRDAHDRFGVERAVAEAEQFSANLWSYFTASENVRLWGSVLRLHPYAEGETFLGFTPLVLAAIAIGALLLNREPGAGARDTGGRASITPRWQRVVIWLLAIAACTQFIALMSTMIFGGFRVEVFGITIRARTATRLLLQFLIPMAILFAMSATARRQALRLLRSPLAFFVVAFVLAVWLSLGPVPAAGYARATGVGLYGVLYDIVPGFNGLRVPARFAMIAGLFLAILGGFGAARILGAQSVAAPTLANSSGERRRAALFAAIAFLVLLEGAAIPFEINRTWNMHEATPPARVMPYSQVPPVYARIAALPEGSVVTEFPFGDGAWEIRYVYYAAAHWKPITNGYSGGFPPRYKERVAHLQRVGVDPDAAWQSLRESGTTHVVVHRGAFAKPDDADVVEAWLKARGATELERLPDGDALWTVN